MNVNEIRRTCNFSKMNNFKIDRTNICFLFVEDKKEFLEKCGCVQWVKRLIWKMYLLVELYCDLTNLIYVKPYSFGQAGTENLARYIFQL